MRIETTQQRLTYVAHDRVASVLKDGDTAVDATAGNGHDTLFLRQQVGGTGRVFAFDIQPQALRSTAARLHEHGISDTKNVYLSQACHSTLATVLEAHSVTSVTAVMFNLGYLPGGNHEVVTTSATTLDAMCAATRLLTSGGVISVMVYIGQSGGLEELEAITCCIERGSLSELNWIQYQSAVAPERAPRLFMAFRS